MAADSRVSVSKDIIPAVGRAVTGKASPRMRLSGRIIFFGMLTK